MVRRLNEGQWQEQILAEVELPEELAASSYLQPLYGCTAFAVRDIMRRYMGWYDGNPSMIFPSSRADVATEVVALTGGTAPVMERARVLGASEETAEIQRALHLVDFVIDSDAPEPQREALQLKSDLLAARAAIEPSFIARNIFRNGATGAAEQAKGR